MPNPNPCLAQHFGSVTSDSCTPDFEDRICGNCPIHAHQRNCLYFLYKQLEGPWEESMDILNHDNKQTDENYMKAHRLITVIIMARELVNEMFFGDSCEGHIHYLRRLYWKRGSLEDTINVNDRDICDKGVNSKTYNMLKEAVLKITIDTTVDQFWESFLDSIDEYPTIKLTKSPISYRERAEKFPWGNIDQILGRYDPEQIEW